MHNVRLEGARTFVALTGVVLIDKTVLEALEGGHPGSKKM